jgi:hypothetical protein
VRGGRLVDGVCRAPTRKRAHKRRCDLTIVTLRRTGRAGANRVPFSARIDGRALPIGSYTAVVVATGRSGTSRPASVGFRIVAP